MVFITHRKVLYRISRQARSEKEVKLRNEKIKQAGIGFPSASLQRHLLIIRMNLARPAMHSRKKKRA